jgi:hypothetical protein
MLIIKHSVAAINPFYVFNELMLDGWVTVALRLKALNEIRSFKTIKLIGNLARPFIYYKKTYVFRKFVIHSFIQTKGFPYKSLQRV